MSAIIPVAVSDLEALIAERDELRAAPALSTIEHLSAQIDALKAEGREKDIKIEALRLVALRAVNFLEERFGNNSGLDWGDGAAGDLADCLESVREDSA